MIKKNTLKLLFITILVFVIFYFFIGIFFKLPMKNESYKMNLIRTILIFFFLLCISTPIFALLKDITKKDVKKYLTIISIAFSVLIISYWGITIINDEQQIDNLKQESKYLHKEVEIEQQELVTQLLENNKYETYKEYGVKGVTELLIALSSFLLIQRPILYNFVNKNNN